MEDEQEKSRFFKETFLLANISMDVILGMPILILSNIENDFIGCHLHWRTYTTTKALLTIRWVELIQKKKFAAVAFNLGDKAFVVYVASIS